MTNNCAYTDAFSTYMPLFACFFKNMHAYSKIHIFLCTPTNASAGGDVSAEGDNRVITQIHTVCAAVYHVYTQSNQVSTLSKITSVLIVLVNFLLSYLITGNIGITPARWRFGKKKS